MSFGDESGGAAGGKFAASQSWRESGSNFSVTPRPEAGATSVARDGWAGLGEEINAQEILLLKELAAAQSDVRRLQRELSTANSAVMATEMRLGKQLADRDAEIETLQEVCRVLLRQTLGIQR